MFSILNTITQLLNHLRRGELDISKICRQKEMVGTLNFILEYHSVLLHLDGLPSLFLADDLQLAWPNSFLDQKIPDTQFCLSYGH
uniref:Uncharacterized protein n=1 Tax=Rhizophora mucronata TaxID=61149 RepID=A0A2P2J1F0_RHIMU